VEQSRSQAVKRLVKLIAVWSVGGGVVDEAFDRNDDQAGSPNKVEWQSWLLLKTFSTCVPIDDELEIVFYMAFDTTQTVMLNSRQFEITFDIDFYFESKFRGLG
jgi:hypothetical protein